MDYGQLCQGQSPAHFVFGWNSINNHESPPCPICTLTCNHELHVTLGVSSNRGTAKSLEWDFP